MMTGFASPPVTARRAVVAAACAAYLLVMMDYSVVNVALEAIQRRFTASTVQLQWVVNAYETVFATLMLPAGFLADRQGRRRVLCGGLLVFAIASAGLATSGSATEVIVWRALMGAGGSVVPAVTLAVIGDVCAPGRREGAMRVWSAMAGASVAIGPVFGGALVALGAWWVPFLVNVPVALACAAVFSFAGPDRAREPVAPLDRLGVVLVTVGVASLVFGVSQWGATGEWWHPSVAGPLLAGGALLTLLIRVETRRTAPVLDVGLLRDRVFASGTACVSLVFFALSGAIFLMTFYLQLIRHHSALETGLAMVPLAAGSIIASLLTGAALARLGPRVTVALGMGAQLAGFVTFASLGESTPVPLVWLGFFAAGAGLGLVMAATTPLTMSVVPAAKAGTAAGTVNLIRAMGVTLGVALLGAVQSTVYSARMDEAVVNSDPALGPGGRDALSQAAGAFVAQTGKAFLAGFHAALWISAAAAACGVAVALCWLPRSLPAPTGRKGMS